MDFGSECYLYEPEKLHYQHLVQDSENSESSDDTEIETERDIHEGR